MGLGLECVSVLNNVTEDFGIEINKVRGYFLYVAGCAILQVRNLDCCGLHSSIISIADPLDWFCWSRHASHVEAEQRWRVWSLVGCRC